MKDRAIPAMVCESGTTRFYRQGISYVQQMYAITKEMHSVDVWTDAPSFSGTYYPTVPLLDISAASDGKHIVLMLLNRSTHDDINVKLRLTDSEEILCEEVLLLTADSLESLNTFECDDILFPQKAPQNINGNCLRLPPHSLTRCILAR